MTRFLPLDREEARRELEKIRKRWFSKRKGLLTLLREALFREEALLRRQRRRQSDRRCGRCACKNLAPTRSAPALPRSPSPSPKTSEDAANEAVRQVQQVADGLGFVTQVESVNAVEAWLGSLPGHAYADVRRPILLVAHPRASPPD